MGHRIAVMRDGVLQQIGTPQDVYRRPANVFVATFLGAPPMNLIDGALEAVAGGGWRFRGQNVDVPLSPEVLSPPELEHEVKASGNVKLGLRLVLGNWHRPRDITRTDSAALHPTGVRACYKLAEEYRRKQRLPTSKAALY